MSVSSLSDLSRQHMLSILGVNQSTQTGQSSKATGLLASLGSGSAASGPASPFAQTLADLQQLETANPKQFSQLTRQLSANFTTAAGKAQNDGNASLASQLSALSSDFSQVSATAANNNAATSGSHTTLLKSIGGLLSKVAGI